MHWEHESAPGSAGRGRLGAQVAQQELAQRPRHRRDWHAVAPRQTEALRQDRLGDAERAEAPLGQLALERRAEEDAHAAADLDEALHAFRRAEVHLARDAEPPSRQLLKD